jgi:hypothetical protein
LLAIVGALGVGGYLYFRLDDEIRRQVERKLADYYHDFDVRVGSARFDNDRGIAINHFFLTPKAPADNSQPVLAIEEMYLAGNVRADQLVTGQLPIDDIVVRRAKLRLVRQADGRWNAQSLLPLPHFGKSSPRVRIENAAVTIEDAGNPTSKPWTINDVDLTLTPAETTVGDDAGGKGFHLDGTTTGLPAKQIRINGDIGASNGQFAISVTALGLEISPEMLANLPGATTAKFQGAEISGLVDLEIKLNRKAADAAVDWSTSIKVDRGRIAHPMLPDVLTDVSLVGRADANQLFIEQLDGRCGSAIVKAAINRAGWSEKAPLGLSVNVVGLMVDDRLRAALPAPYLLIWDRFKPAGLIDGEVRVTFDGKKWRPVLAANCHGISLTDAEKFPYTLQQTTGRVEYHPAENGRDDRLTLNLTGFGGGQPVKVEAELKHLAHAEVEEGVTTGIGVASADLPQGAGAHAAGYRGIGFGDRQPDRHPLGFVKISGNNIPLHEQLLAALPPGAQSFVRSLQAQGTIDFLFRAEWKDLAQPRAVVTQEVRLNDCEIKFLPFPYPLQHLHGVAKENNSRWTLEGFEGRGATDATIVKCRGEAVPNSSGYNIDLTINAQDVPLDDTLKTSLSPAGQRAWEELRPVGRINFDAHATKQAGQVEPVIAVDLRPCGNAVSIEPRMFYRLEQIQGQAKYQRGRVDMHNVVAVHDRTRYSAETGLWQAAADGGWQLGFSNANVDRLVMGRDLLVALPPALQSTIERFQPTGTISFYNSGLSLSKSPQFESFGAAWDVNLECQQASIQGAVPFRGVNGGVHLVGRTDGRSMVTAGEIAFDSLLCKDVQLTNVHGPLWIDSSQFLVGEPACRQQQQALRRATADAYGGSVAANVVMMRGDNPNYNLDVHVGGASLARFASERLGTANDMGGTVSGELVVAGTGHTTDTLRGAGKLHIVDANIYQLPPLVAMLKLLSNRPPNATAFNRCDMVFDIQGEHIDFQQLDLLGDAVSLHGKGKADFNHRLDLVFFTLLGPDDFPIPIVKTIVGHVSQQGLQIKVVGTFEHPETERKAVPFINDMLDKLQGGLQEGAATMSPNAAGLSARSPTK